MMTVENSPMTLLLLITVVAGVVSQVLAAIHTRDWKGTLRYGSTTISLCLAAVGLAMMYFGQVKLVEVWDLFVYAGMAIVVAMILLAAIDWK